LRSFDFGLYKSVKLPREGMKGAVPEFFSFFNHSNLFVDPGTNLFTGADSPVTASNLRIATTILVKPVSRLIYRLRILFKVEIQKSE
jgi:hypothetical protein